MRAVDRGMARPSEVIEYHDPSLKEEESIHHDFNFEHRHWPIRFFQKHAGLAHTGHLCSHVGT